MECNIGTCGSHNRLMTDNCAKGEPPDVENCQLRKRHGKPQVAPPNSSDLLSVVKEIRKHDCGGWLKTDWEGACKRLELMALLEKLYKAAGINI